MLCEACQSQQWRHEIDPNLTTPMVCIGNQDFYIFEVTKLMDGQMCMPLCWFVQEHLENGHMIHKYYADACTAEPVVFDSGGGYVVHEYDVFQVAASELLLSFPHLVQTYHIDGLPDPHNLIGMNLNYTSSIKLC